MFKTWCKKNNFYEKNGEITHVLMDGGILYIPDDKTSFFFKKYIECIKNEKIFVVEQKTSNFNFFVDIDYQDDDELGYNELQSILDLICGKIETFSKQKALVSVAKPKKKGNLIKSGVHINWHGFVVDQRMAVNLMYHIIETLTNVYPYRDWTQIIDSSVYGNLDTGSKGSGFRIPWSHKKSKHAECSGKGCIVCKNTGKIDEVAYLPVMIYENGDLTQIESQKPDYDLLMLSLVRTFDSLSDVTIPEVYQLVSPKKVKKEGDFTKRQMKDEVNDVELQVYLGRFINQNIKGFERASIMKMYKQNKDIYFVQTDSKYCMNLGREHTSNHVYFMIKKKSISQKCFCRCDTMKGRRVSFCKDFSSPDYKLSPSIINLLYK